MIFVLRWGQTWLPGLVGSRLSLCSTFVSPGLSGPHRSPGWLTEETGPAALSLTSHGGLLISLLKLKLTQLS